MLGCVVLLGMGGAASAVPNDCLQGEAVEALKAKYDFNKDGCIDKAEQQVMLRDLKINPPPPKPPKKEPPDPYAAQPVFIVRDAYPAKAFLSEGRKTSDTGAVVSYARDRANDKTTWTVKGSATAGIVKTSPIDYDKLDELQIHRTAFLIGVESDRTFQNVAPKQKGSISAKGGFEVEGWSSGEFFRHYVKGDVVYTTDYSGGASVYGFETLYQPMAKNFLIGHTAKPRFLGGKVWVGFWPTLAFDYFHVGNNGTFDALTTGKDYAWAGTKLTASLGFDEDYLKRLTFLAKYIYMPEFGSGTNATVNYRQFSAQYALIQDEQENDILSLEARWTRGNTPRTLEIKDDFYAGLTFKLGALPGSKDKDKDKD
jgi:hypothetical protein